jgi:DNA mismatch repair protein MutL
MGRINVLDENMVNMIAAGEVIERPASVVKELLENSIDAGAGKIIINIEDGGRRFISVIDDGEGMAREDLAFEPHATSKIKRRSDLEHISTMGFRGEALASIASVAQVRAVSRMKDSLEAHSIEIDCGKKTEPAPCSGDYGTTIEVRNLFYKLPARRKFLRTANTEMTHIIEHFTRIALAHCSLDMTLVHNGRELYRLLDGQSLTERIAKLFSAQIAESLFVAEGNERGLEISCLLGRPDVARASGKFQYFFLNGRFIRDKFISHAVKEAYRGIIEPNKYPVVFLFLQMPCEAYDVNVHPTKIEVRFDNANLVHSQILAVVRQKLLGQNLDAPAQIPKPRESMALKEETIQHSEIRRQRIAEAMAEFFREHRPIQTQQHLGFAHPSAQSQQAEMAKQPAPVETDEQPAVTKSFGEAGRAEAPRKFLQLHNSYIVSQVNDGFIVIDQHALHERIIYEDLCRRIAASTAEKLVSQRLLIPETIELTDAQAEVLRTNAELFEKLGIGLEPFGPKTIAIQAFPSLLAKVAPAEFAQELLDLLTEKAVKLDRERLLHEVLEMAACRAAVKAGQKLTDGEIERLLAEREVIERASQCPHGRPTTIKFSLSELEKQFKRT